MTFYHYDFGLAIRKEKVLGLGLTFGEGSFKKRNCENHNLSEGYEIQFIFIRYPDKVYIQIRTVENSAHVFFLALTNRNILLPKRLRTT